MPAIDGVEVDVTPAPGVEIPVARGPQGNAVELQTSATHIQWRVIGTATWNDLVPLADIEGTPGATGPAPEIQVAGGYIQWREPEGVWQNLIAVADLEGEPGADSTVPGPQGDGFTGGSYNATTGEVTFTSDDGLGFTTGDLRGEPGNDGDTHVPDPSGEADGRMLSVQSGALVYGDAPAGGGSTAWVDLTGVPTEFPPEAHTHVITNVTGLTAALAAKVDTASLGTAATAATTDFATAAQGALADSATQPGDLATVATSGAYGDLTGTPTLGTAAAAATADFATAGQGALAESAVQPTDIADVVRDSDVTDVIREGDSRLTDARTPTTHSHDVDDINATGTPDGTKFLRGDGAWATPAGGGSSVDPTADIFMMMGA